MVSSNHSNNKWKFSTFQIFLWNFSIFEIAFLICIRKFLPKKDMGSIGSSPKTGWKNFSQKTIMNGNVSYVGPFIWLKNTDFQKL